MENILESKKLITDEINSIFIEYQNRIEENNSKEKEWIKEKEIMNQANHRLIQEVAEKDKLLFHNEKKFLDYEVIINKVQDEALKEMDEKTKHDMLRAQDREIFERDEEIKRLQKKIECLEEEKTLVVSTVKEVVQEVEEFKEGNTKTLVEKMKDATEEQVKEQVKEEVEEEVTEEVKEEVKEEVEEEVKEEVESDDSEEDSFTVSTITHYNKDYYIIDGEEPIQYIYAIEDGELGEKKGVMKNGKKKMYKKN